MQGWLVKNESTSALAKNAEEITQAYEATNAKNHGAMMQGVMHADPDIAFAKGMIPHHQGAIDMVEVELKYGKSDALLELARDMKTAQTTEIKQMQNWLAKKGVK